MAPDTFGTYAITSFQVDRRGGPVDEKIGVPPEVLETFIKIKSLVDATVEQLQTLQVSESGTPESIASVSVVARPETVQARAHIPTPSVATLSGMLPALSGSMDGYVTEIKIEDLPTEEEVRNAWVWLAAVSTGVAGAMTFFGNLESLLQLIERLHRLIP